MIAALYVDAERGPYRHLDGAGLQPCGVFADAGVAALGQRAQEAECAPS